MLLNLHRVSRGLTRSFPRGFRALMSPSQSGDSSSIDGSGMVATSSLPPPAQYPVTASQQSYDAYAFPSTATEIQPILDIPPESDPLLAYLTSHLMRHGKRHAAARRASNMLLHLHALTRSPPLPIFREAVARAAPSIRIVSHKKGGKNMQKPVPLGEKQRTKFAITWMLDAAKHWKGRTIEERLAREALAIIKAKPEDIRGKLEDNKAKPEDNRGKPEDNKGKQAVNEVLKKKYEVHKLGMVNRGNVRSRY